MTGMRPLVRSDELTRVLQILRPLIRLWPRRATRSGKPRMAPTLLPRCAECAGCLIMLLLQAGSAKKPATSTNATAATIIAATMLVADALIGGSSGEFLC